MTSQIKICNLGNNYKHFLQEYIYVAMADLGTFSEMLATANYYIENIILWTIS